MLPAASTSSKEPLFKTEGISVLNKVSENASKYGCYLYLPCSWPHTHSGYPGRYSKGTDYQEVKQDSIHSALGQATTTYLNKSTNWPSL